MHMHISCCEEAVLTAIKPEEIEGVQCNQAGMEPGVGGNSLGNDMRMLLVDMRLAVYRRHP
jgi:hypothetical protein